MRVVPPGSLGVGIQLPVQSQSKTFAAKWESGGGPDDIAAVAEAADAAGFLYVAVCDHVAVPRDDADHMGTTWYDTVATLGFLAARTSRVRLLSHVWVLANRHPLHTASAFATLDRLSGGRVILGVGAGHLAGEMAALDVDYARRGALTDEALDAVVAALEHDFVRHDGKAWSFHDVGVGPRPIQRPRPPIWVGGSSPAALRRVGERGDGWLPQGTRLADIPDALATIRRHQEAAGRADHELDLGANGPWFWLGETDRDLPPTVVTGSAERVAEVLRRFHGAGVSHVQVGVPARSVGEWQDQLAGFGRDVMPLLPGAGGGA